MQSEIHDLLPVLDCLQMKFSDGKLRDIRNTSIPIGKVNSPTMKFSNSDVFFGMTSSQRSADPR